MSVKLNLNNRIAISRDDPSFESVKDLLTIVEKELVVKKEYDYKLKRYKKINSSRNVTKYLYNLDEDNLYLPYGIYKYVKYLFKNSDVKYCGIKDHKIMNTVNIVDNIERYRNILPGISLYDNQLEAIKRIFQYKRGVIQAGTGFGKTELMCACTQILKELNDNKYPTVIVLEPTIELLKGIKQRFKKYKIPVNDYRETRMILKNKVNLAHPKSLCNDLLKNKNLLDKVEVQFIDEAHHGGALSFSTPTQYMPNLMYSIGLSATFLSHYHVNGQNIDDFNYEELRRIGACGPIIMKIDGKDLIENQQLATPKLCILNNKANEEIDETKLDYTWQNVSKIRLQSDVRTKLIAQAACVFIKHGYKVIILMNFLDWGRRIMTEIYNLGYGDYVRTCFGGQTYEKINKKTGKVEKEWNSTLSLFDKDKIYCIVGSSCVQEGLDLSKVDVCILAQGGKSDRTTLQSVGRALRKSKTGKYSWIVDIEDMEDEMLHKQYIERMQKYKKVLGLTEKDEVFKNLNPKTLEEIFCKYENI